MRKFEPWGVAVGVRQESECGAASAEKEERRYRFVFDVALNTSELSEKSMRKRDGNCWMLKPNMISHGTPCCIRRGTTRTF